ncbi:hypothetical protein N2488_02520 [SAR92 clade bacterium H231]|jgi:hypothetical protein|nr:hypothetical protein [SAR92 clade bacterium H231]MDA7767263.1 hypothetical protein [Porticoccaceae bacterium]MDA8978487.1 hypothetical protein [bacterium]MDB2547640.1 hypothetical protein [Porticoccaceae bacterium]MDC0953261.1 hypothetical protein [Porticoccaceae bacterium]
MSISIEQLTAFLGWCTLINIGLLLFSTLILALVKDFAINMHSKIFDLDPETLPAMYFDYLGRLKLLVIVFNLVPYLALRIIQ